MSIPQSLNWNVPSNLRPSVEERIAEIDWEKLCLRASELHDGEPCVLLEKLNAGLNHVVRLLSFPDSDTLWIVKVPLRESTGADPRPRSYGIQTEVDVMRLLRERTNIQIPRIFDYEPTAANAAGVPYMLMEFLRGNVAMDCFGGWDSHHGIIPSQCRQDFYRSVAKMQVELTAVRFPKIGIIERDIDGNYDVGPFPNIGGPFDSPESFMAAWAKRAKFPGSSLDILAQMDDGDQRDVAREISASVLDFPARLHTMVEAKQITFRDGPFPLNHTDLMHSNIVVDEEYKVLGFIDWEGACTLPWELVEYPLFLDTLPRLFDIPDKYDANGEPVDCDTKQGWLDRKAYLGEVKASETMDCHLSSCLADARGQSLAFSIRLFNPGKLGFYNRVLEQFLVIDN